MGMFSAPKAPPPPPPPPPPPEPPKKVDPAVSQARRDEVRRARQQSGIGGTRVTGSQGLLDPASTTGRTLLGG